MPTMATVAVSKDKEDDDQEEAPSLLAANGQQSSPSSSSASSSGQSEASEDRKLGTPANIMCQKQELEAKKVASPLLEMASADSSGVEATAVNMTNNVAAPPQAGVANHSVREETAPAPPKASSVTIPDDENQNQVTTGAASGGSQDVTASGKVAGGGEAPVVPSDPVVSRFVDGCARLGDLNKKRKDNLRMLNAIGRLFPEDSTIRSNATCTINSYLPNQTASLLSEEVRNIVSEVSTFSKTLHGRESRIADLMGHCNALYTDLQNFYAEGSINSETSQLLAIDSVINVGGSPFEVDGDTHKVLTRDSRFAFLMNIFTSKLDTDDQGRVFLDMSVDVFKAMVAQCTPIKSKASSSRRPKKPKTEHSTSKDDSLGSVISSYYIGAVHNPRPMCPMTIDQLIFNVLPGGDGGEFPVSLIYPDPVVQARLMKQLPALGDPLTTTSLLYQGDVGNMDCSDFWRCLEGVENTLLFILDEGFNLAVMYNEQPLTDEPVARWRRGKKYLDAGVGRNNFAIIKQPSAGQKKKEGQNVDGENVSSNGDSDEPAAYFTVKPISEETKVVQVPWVTTDPRSMCQFAMPFNFGKCTLQLKLGCRALGSNICSPTINQNIIMDPYWTTDAAEDSDSGSTPDLKKRSNPSMIDFYPRKTNLGLLYMVAIKVNTPNKDYLAMPSARLHSILNKAREKFDVFVDYCPEFQAEADDRKKGHDDVADSALSNDCPIIDQCKGLRSVKAKCESLYKDQDKLLRDALEASLCRVRHCFMARHFSFYPKGKLVRITTHPNLDPIVTRLDTVASFDDSKLTRQIICPSLKLLDMTVTDSLHMDNHGQFQELMSKELLGRSIKLRASVLESVIPSLYSKEHIQHHSHASVTQILDGVVRSIMNDSYAIPDVLADAKIIVDHLDDVRNRARWIDVDLTYLFATKSLKRRAMEIIIDHMRLVRLCKSGLIPRPQNIADIAKELVNEPECQVQHVQSALIELGIMIDRY